MVMRVAWVLVGLVLPVGVAAQVPEQGMRPGDAKCGTLLLRTAEGLRPAPTVVTDVQIEVTGMVARTTVEQRFRNPGDGWVEGVYVFPLPERAAVDTLALVVGGRLIVGEIRTRGEARATYRKARKEGRKASLLEQERPNLFTTSVTGIGPGEEVRIGIEYQEDLRFDAGGYSLRFPMVVGPRYVPGGGHVPDAARITPPVRHPQEGPINPVRIRVELDSGVPLARLHSPSHAVRIRPLGGHRRAVELAKQSVPADSDFVLTWRPAPADAPVAALFHEEKEGERYALLMVMPPDPTHGDQASLPRETIFVIDTSGSMHGASIEQARRALGLALARLRPADRFNVIAFSSSTRRLFPRAVHAQPVHVDDAQRWVASLQAQGGTEMLPALQVALDPSEEGSRVRQVVFITDGAIGNEARLFAEIRSRLFTVGIGSAPNGHFMARAAELGRGTSTTISQIHEVREKMDALFAKLESPVLTDIRLEFDVDGAEAWPSRVPDLYLGEPVVVAARLPAGAGRFRVAGLRGGEPWQAELGLEAGVGRAGVSRLWARRKIASLTGSLHDEADPKRVREAVVALGLRHHLVTRHTSLVAVDVTPTAPLGVVPDLRALPTNLPKGWSYEHVFGELRAREGAPAAPPPPLEHARRGPRLPQGGTSSALFLWLGVACLLAAGLTWRRRQAV